jgi:hypothetical protein
VETEFKPQYRKKKKPKKKQTKKTKKLPSVRQTPVAGGAPA